jgi:hypothetical protein
MRTTLNLPDHLLVEAKKVAAERRLSLTRLMEESLRRYLAEDRAERRNMPALRPLPVIEGARPVVGVDLDDTSALMEL